MSATRSLPKTRYPELTVLKAQSDLRLGRRGCSATAKIPGDTA